MRSFFSVLCLKVRYTTNCGDGWQYNAFSVCMWPIVPTVWWWVQGHASSLSSTHCQRADLKHTKSCRKEEKQWCVLRVALHLSPAIVYIYSFVLFEPSYHNKMRSHLWMHEFLHFWYLIDKLEHFYWTCSYRRTPLLTLIINSMHNFSWDHFHNLCRLLNCDYSKYSV